MHSKFSSVNALLWIYNGVKHQTQGGSTGRNGLWFMQLNMLYRELLSVCTQTNL